MGRATVIKTGNFPCIIADTSPSIAFSPHCLSSPVIIFPSFSFVFSSFPFIPVVIFFLFVFFISFSCCLSWQVQFQWIPLWTVRHTLYGAIRTSLMVGVFWCPPVWFHTIFRRWSLRNWHSCAREFTDWRWWLAKKVATEWWQRRD